MKYILTLLVLVLLVTQSNAQIKVIRELEKSFHSKDFNTTIVLGNNFLSMYPNNPQIMLFIGMSLVETEKYIDALPYLEKVSYDKFNDSDTTRSWALGYLGCCTFMLEGPDEAEKYFERTYKSNGTIHSEKFIKGTSKN